MGIWIELRCEGRGDNPRGGEEVRSGSRCLSHANAGPMGLARDTRESALATIKLLENEARTSGWKRTRNGWACPHCAKVRLSHGAN